MLATIHRISAWLLVALGAAHTLLTVPIYGRIEPDAVWFAGTGLMMVFLGLLNLITLRTDDGGAWRLCRAADLLGAGFGVLAVLAVPEPQAVLGLVLLAGLAAGTFRARSAA